MIFREATIEDIPALQVIRSAVKENVLNNPLLVTQKDYVLYLTTDGKGWLCETNNTISGFAIVNIQQNNIWALFVHPDFEKRGIGKKLQTIMLDWYFKQTKKSVWLSTAPNSRAERFYNLTGWNNIGFTKNGEAKFEMSFDGWEKLRI